MIRHIVFFGVRPDVPAEQVDESIAALRGLPALIPEIRSYEVARDEIGGERSATFGLVSEFDDFDALQRYQTNPDHKAVASRAIALCDWVKAWDYTLP